jgi:hypothetical protein
MRVRRNAWSDEAARAADLGQLRQGHRAVNELSAPARWIWSITIVVVLIMAFHEVWLGILIIVLLVAAGTIGYVYLPVSGSGHTGTLFSPSRVAVYERGLVIGDGQGGGRAVRWEQVLKAGPVRVSEQPVRFAFRASYTLPASDPGTARVTDEVSIGNLTSRSALVRSIMRRTAVPVRRWPRAVAGAVAAAAVGACVWGVLPSPSVVSQVPSYDYLFSGACTSGTAFTAQPAYSGVTPHPAIAFVNEGGGYNNPLVEPSDLARVQLVACAVAAGDASGGGKECPYALELNPLQNGPVVGPTTYVTLTPAWYNVTVYVARTHREIGSTRIVGDDLTCPQQIRADTTALSSQPTADQLNQALAPYVEASR